MVSLSEANLVDQNVLSKRGVITSIINQTTQVYTCPAGCAVSDLHATGPHAGKSMNTMSMQVLIHISTAEGPSILLSR